MPVVSIPPSTFRLPVCPYSYQKGLFPLTVCPYIAIYETDIYFFTLRTVRGRASGDGTWEHRETHWEKCDWNGYKELGAELSGFNQEGDAWWETWREVYKPGGVGGRAGSSREQDSDANADDDDNERIERGADKWARDKTGKEWHEKWWEKFERTGASERSVEKSGRQGIQAWWEKWGEQVRPCAFPKSRTTILSLTLVTVRTDYGDCCSYIVQYTSNTRPTHD